MEEFRVCKTCGETKPITEFCINYTNKSTGMVYRRNVCKACDYPARNLRARGRKGTSEESVRLRKERGKRYQDSPKNRPAIIVRDSKKSDKIKGLENDLDVGWVREAIVGGCTYCGETTLKMSLDRIDNSLGHLKSNVIRSCTRCNYLRRDMPYEAWLIICQSVRKVRELGLFGNWTCGISDRNLGK